MTHAPLKNIRKVALIVATGPQGEIGLGGDLLWHLPGDLQYFKRLTTGHPLVMGRRTFESIGRALPGRISVVVSRDEDFREKIDRIEHGKGVCSLEEALEYVDRLDGGFLSHPHEPFIAGGGQIYRESLEKGLVDTVYLTTVQKNYRADTFFPLDMLKGWTESWREEHPAQGDAPAFTYLKLERPTR